MDACQFHQTPDLFGHLVFYLTLLFLTIGSEAAAQSGSVQPCTPSVPGCLDGVPPFYLVASPATPWPDVINVPLSADVAQTIGSLFLGVTGVEPGELVRSQVRRELVDFVVASPSGGFTVGFSKRSRSFLPRSTSYGPTFAERALTQGRGTWSAGIDYQFYSYGHVVGSPRVSSSTLYLFGNQVLWEVSTALRMTRDQLNTHVTYGLSDHIDISALMPVISTRVEGTQALGVPGRQPDLRFAFTAAGEGLGDIVLGAKVAGWELKSSRIGLQGSVAFATGNTATLSGLGYSRVKMSGVWSSAPHGLFQPHANLAVTAPLTTSTRAFDINMDQYSLTPKVLEVVAGVDLAASRAFTTSVDVVVRGAIDSARVEYGRVDAIFPLGILIDGRVRCCIDRNQTYYPVAASATTGIVAFGGKWNVAPHVLVIGNAVLPFGRYTIRPRPTVSIGVEIGGTFKAR